MSGKGGVNTPNSSGSKRCCFTTVVKTALSHQLEPKTDEGEQGLVFGDASWAERLIAAELQSRWRCLCCPSETAVMSFWCKRSQRYGKHTETKPCSFLPTCSMFVMWIHSFFFSPSFEVNCRFKYMKEKNERLQWKKKTNADKQKMKTWGGLHMWDFSDIKASRDTARKEPIPDDTVHM